MKPTVAPGGCLDSASSAGQDIDTVMAVAADLVTIEYALHQIVNVNVNVNVNVKGNSTSSGRRPTTLTRSWTAADSGGTG